MNATRPIHIVQSLQGQQRIEDFSYALFAAIVNDDKVSAVAHPINEDGATPHSSTTPEVCRV